MEEILQSVATKLNIPLSSVRAGVYALVNLLREKVPAEQFDQFLDRVPGAREFMQNPPPVAEPAPGAGLFGGLFGAASSLLGGQAGDLAKAAAVLEANGIDTQKLAPFVQAFIEKSREVAGPEVVDEVLKKIPLLQSFVGRSPAA
jgi:hypothetical protein